MSRQSDLRYSSTTQMSQFQITYSCLFLYKLDFGLMSAREYTDKEAVEQFGMYESTIERFSVHFLYVYFLVSFWPRQYSALFRS